jgi:hypothetical protein
MEEFFSAVIKSYGLVGVIFLLPTAALFFLAREYLRLQKRFQDAQKEHALFIDELGKRVAAAQEKRVDDSHSVTTKLVEMIGEQSAASEKTNLALDRIGDMVTTLMAAQAVGIQRKVGS